MPCIKSDLFNLVEKLQSELQAKNQELQVKHEKLAKEKQKMKVCKLFIFENLYMNKSYFASEIVNRFSSGKSWSK
jgi:ATP-dependent protease HslVU (ClpYQ) peptidase subunit